MPKELNIRVSPETAGQPEKLKDYIAGSEGVTTGEIHHIQILKRSIDARQKNVIINLRVQVWLQKESGESATAGPTSGLPGLSSPPLPPDCKDVSRNKEVIIIGAGPAGLFAAMQLIENGLKPVILERGKDVRSRIADLKKINVDHIVNEDSNYCFGEGGAGTYSDGKLYTRSTKRGDVRMILERLVAFGASGDILIDAHPHIGTNKLPPIISEIREWIKGHGGVIHFNTRVTDFILSGDRITGVVAQRVATMDSPALNDKVQSDPAQHDTQRNNTTSAPINTGSQGDTFSADHVILATGHSARDIFQLLRAKGIDIELKPLAMGIRVEHPQALIDSIRYHCADRGEWLPPSSYNISKQIGGRGVYSFCMCPGGVIAPCATSPGEIVTNGWSSSRRARATANSGIVVELRPDDFREFSTAGPLAAMEYQKSIEHRAFEAGGRTQRAPAQRLVDFLDGKVSGDLPSTSYSPGITSVDLRSVLPDLIYKKLRDGFREIEKSMKGYLTNDAVIHAPETRTSSPVTIPRDPRTLQHIRISGLYPCGEGAGYAGGIVSAAIDGINCARAVHSDVAATVT